MTLILTNTFFMATRFYPADPTWSVALYWINFSYAIAFAIEMVLKLIGLGPCQYASTGWNRFDGTLVVFSFLGMIVKLGQFATLLRIIRVARIVRLVRTSENVLTLFKTLIYSLPSL